MIYFAQRPGGGPVRTGILTGPATQSDDCRTELDPSFRILAVVEGGTEEWRALLRRFSHLKVGGDWLRPGPDLLDFIHLNIASAACKRSTGSCASGGSDPGPH